MNGSPVALVVESLGWTLLDFVWQGTLVAGALCGLLALARNASANTRYLMSCAALLVASTAVALTFVWQIDVAGRRATGPELAGSDSVAGDARGAEGLGPAVETGIPLDPAAQASQPAAPAAAEAVRELQARAWDAWTDRLRHWLPTIVSLWAAGVGLLSLRLIVGWRAIRRLREAGREVDDAVWVERFAQLRVRLGVSRTVRLLTSASASVPFVVGWLRPVVLVPAGLLTGLTPNEIEAIFAHELAHIRRHDYLVNLAQNVVETLLFYHPAIWWISAQIRRERENCCDDVAAAICGGALDYAKALVALERMRPAGGLVVAASGGSLLARIRRLAGAGASGSNRSAWPLPVLVLFLGAAIALVAAGESGQGEQKDTAPPPSFRGAEIIARVGLEVILASDVLPDANSVLERMLRKAPQPPSPEEIERARKLYMSKFLDHLIEIKLVVVEGRRHLPKEAWGKIEKQFNEPFDKHYLPKLLQREACASRAELDAKLRKSGSSLESLRRQAMENNFAQHWMDEKIKDDGEITDDEIEAYYREHLATFERPGRARWEHLMARFDKFDTKEEARLELASWDLEVRSGTQFAKVARAHSQDISASGGGIYSWTDKGWLGSKVLDDAVFTLPIGQLSEILEDRHGFHIIRVIERKDPDVTPLAEAQAEIKKKIRDERINDKRLEYKANLRKKIPVWNIFKDAAGDFKAEPADEVSDEVSPEQESLEPAADGTAITVVDAATKQPIPRFRVLAGVKGEIGASEEVKERHPGLKFPIWLPATLRDGENGTLLWPPPRFPRYVEQNDEMALRVEADGYQPQASPWLRSKTPPVTFEFALIADAGVTGQILQPDGRPAKGATLAIAMGGKPINITNGQIRREIDRWPEKEWDRWLRSGRAETDAEGNFQLPMETDPGAAVLIVHESGVLEMSFADFRNHPRLTLKRWGRVVGQVLWKDRVGSGEPVCAGTVRQYEYVYPGAVRASASTHTDAQGNFVLDKVLPGRVGVSGGIDLPNPPRRSGMSPLNFDRRTLEIDSDGEPAAVLIGGRGRTVTGRLTGRDSWEGVTLKYLPKVPESVAFAGDGVSFGGGKWEMWRLHGLWERSPIGPLYFRSELKPNADGSFEISGVLPGDYRLFVTAAGAKHYVAGAEFAVEHERPGEAPPLLALGEIKVTKAEKPVGPAEETEPAADDAKPETEPQGKADTDEITISVIDAATKQPIPNFRLSVAARATEIDKLLGYRARVRWQPVLLRKSGDNGFAFSPLAEWDGEMTLRVEADGYRTAPMTWRQGHRPKHVTFHMHVDAGISGRILQPDGQPAAGATVAIATPERKVILKNDQIMADIDLAGAIKYIVPAGAVQRSDRPLMAKADGDGRFSIATEDDRDAWVYVVHESGVREMTNADFRERPNVTLDRWGRVEGQVLWKDRIGADERVGLSISFDYPSIISGGADEIRSDADGRFVFERVLPGAVHVGRVFERSRLPRGWGSTTVVGPESLVTVTAGETARVLIGGKGRTVKGRLTGRTHWEGVNYSFAPPHESHKFPVTFSRPFDQQRRGAHISWETLTNWRSSSVGPLYFRDLRPNADGSFEISDLLPGTYRLVVSAADVAGIAAQIEYSLPAERPGETTPAIFLGEIPVPARAGERISPGEGELFRGDIEE